MVLTEEQIKKHYLTEKELATRLKTSSKAERCHLYTDLYDELFRQVPYHSQLTNKNNAISKVYAGRQLSLISAILKPDTRFLEIGPGDCSFALTVAPLVKTVTVIDVSNEITANIRSPPNFKLVISDGSNIEVQPGSIDVAYSDQLIEHLHPDDVVNHLKSVYNSLAPRGVYVCCTPNRLSGPHDVSRFFDDVATGFHLREYSFTDLEGMMRQISFKKFRCYVGGRGRYLHVPFLILKIYEKAVSAFPLYLRRRLRNNIVFKASLNIHIVATK